MIHLRRENADHERRRSFPIIEPTNNSFVEDDDLEFLEASWCNRNAHWVTFVFAGYGIDTPVKYMQLVDEWEEDLKEAIANREKIAYMVTVPRLYPTEGTPSNFFYNTHFFVVQLVVPTEEILPVRLKIFAGFARHYRMIDYLQEWDINDGIDPTHRLKMNRTTYAVETFSQELLFGHFLPNLKLMMQELNTFVWTRTANDIHADLFYADKFKDMINLSKRGLVRPTVKQEIRFAKKPLVFLSENLNSASNSIENDEALGKVSNYNESNSQSAKPTPEELMKSEIPADGFYVPLLKPKSGAYYLAIRKYAYTDKSCAMNANLIRRSCYGPDSNRYLPALPLKMHPEEYGPYKERDSLPKKAIG